jgi:hypothetical protein
MADVLGVMEERKKKKLVDETLEWLSQVRKKLHGTEEELDDDDSEEDGEEGYAWLDGHPEDGVFV